MHCVHRLTDQIRARKNKKSIRRRYTGMDYNGPHLTLNKSAWVPITNLCPNKSACTKQIEFVATACPSSNLLRTADDLYSIKKKHMIKTLNSLVEDLLFI